MIASLHASEKKFLLILFVMSFLVRAFIFTSVIQKDKNAWFYPDSEQYDTNAWQLAQGQGNNNLDGTPQMYRLPGYPLFLAGCYKLFGHDVTSALWIQIILASLIPLLIFFLSLVLFPAQMLLAKTAGLLAAVHIGFGLYAGMLATESLSLIALLCFFIMFFRDDAQNAGSSFLVGCVLGLASLIRPIGVYTVFVSIILLFFGHVLFVQCIKNGLAFFAGWVLVVSPWLIRNFLLTGALFFHTLPGLHFLQYSAAYVVMERDSSGYGDARPMLLKQWDDEVSDQEKKHGRRLDEYERSVIAQGIAFDYMKRYPWYTAKTSLIQMIKTCCSLYCAQTLLSDSGKWPDYTKDTMFGTKVKRFLFPEVKHNVLIGLIYAEIICMLAMMLGLFFFVMRLLFDPVCRKSFVKVVPFMLMFVFITLAYGCARLRFPIEPCIIIFSAAGWLWMYGNMRTSTSIF